MKRDYRVDSREMILSEPAQTRKDGPQTGLISQLNR